MNKAPITDAELDAYADRWTTGYCLSDVKQCDPDVFGVCLTCYKSAWDYTRNVAGSALRAARPYINRLNAEHDARVTELLEANNREVERRRAAEAKLRCAGRLLSEDEIEQAKKTGAPLLGYFAESGMWHNVKWCSPSSSYIKHWCIEGRWTPIICPAAFMAMPVAPDLS